MKKIIKKMLNGLFGILILLAFMLFDFFVSCIPLYFIKPESYLGMAISFFAFIVIFIIIIIVALMILANKVSA